MEANAHTILVIDDEEDVVDLICFNLEKDGYVTLRALDGQTGVNLACQHRPSAIVLDLMLPGLDGFQVFEALRQDARTRHIPVLMVTAKAETADRIAGLKAGVDDYLTKPFSPKELVLRVKALLKWVPDQTGMVVESGPFYLDKSALCCYIDGEEVSLTSTEFRLLAMLVSREGETVTREDLIEHIWGASGNPSSRSLDTHLMRLREKLGADAALIKNVRGKGYRYHH